MRVVVFDMDGLMINTEELYTMAGTELLRRRGHQFTEELKEAIGAPSLYNESLGTVSGNYLYDRVQNRDEPAAARPKKPWEKAKSKRHA